MPVHSIQKTVIDNLPANRGANSKGWRTFNAVCCTHNGESADSRGRGGVIANPDGGVSYSCFNCNFKTGYVPGYSLSAKFRKLLRWLNVDDLEIHRLAIEALREKERQELLGLVKPDVKKEEVKTNFIPHQLPPGALTFYEIVAWHELQSSSDYSQHMVDAVKYVYDRKIDMKKYDFYITDDTSYKMDKRVVVPFKWKNKVIGYSARALNESIKPKYVTHVDNGFVFNMDAQQKDWQFVIVCEGIFDALSIDGVAIMKSDMTKLQIELIESLDREVIVVPDWNKSGQHLIDVALANNWSVSFPVWAETCVDINDAVSKYGKLFVLKTILDSVERNQIKIQLLKRKYI